MAKKTKRDEDISTKPKIAKRLLEIFKEVDEGFINQRSRSDNIMDYWDAYNCVLGPRQIYTGNSQVYVPIIRDAIKARRTRFVNQLFPQSGRYVDVVSENGEIPHGLMALIEHYVRDVKLRTQIINTLMVNGDIEGQYTIYVDWNKVTRHVAQRVKEGVKIDGLEHPELEEIERVKEETIEQGYPAIDVINDPDFLVMPASANSIAEALEVGGSVTVLRRWTKGKIRQMIEDGDIEEAAGEVLLKAMTKKDSQSATDVTKQLADTAGIRKAQSGKIANVYETWTRLKVNDEMRLCRAYYGGEDQILGCKLNPFWDDECPVLSAPVEKMPNVFKGVSLIQPGILDMQIAANDAINEGLDSATYALSPIIMTDPEKNPRVGSMVLDLAAVWQVDPNSTKFAEFPKLWNDAFAIVAQAQQKIFQSLSVNPAMIPQQTGGKAKRNQAEIANEQAVDILTTADVVSNLEVEIMTPLINKMLWRDMQFREDEVLIEQMGEMGLRAIMDAVAPIQMNERWSLKWLGVEAARNAAQIQQQIAAMNVVRGIPPEQYKGYELNLQPAISLLVENAFGPRLAPLIFRSIRDNLGMDPEVENGLLNQGFEVIVHAGDDDVKHIQAHLADIEALGDPTKNKAAHIQRHQMQMQSKMQQQGGGQGEPGVPGGAGPGVPGTPRPGAQPQGPKMMRGHPGAMNPDRMPAAGAVQMPRKM